MLSCAWRMTGGPWSTGTVVPMPLGLVVSPGCPLIVVGAPVDAPPDWPAPPRSAVDPPLGAELPAPPHAAAATRIAMMTRTFFIRRPPRRNSELSDQTLDRAARNIRRRASGQKPRHRRRRAPGALRRKLHRAAGGQSRVGRTQRRRQDEPAQGAGGRRRPA